MNRPTINHTAPSPFPFRLLGGALITDEWCGCGHPRSAHHDARNLIRAGAPFPDAIWGYGRCARRDLDGCACVRFTWEAYNFA